LYLGCSHTDRSMATQHIFWMIIKMCTLVRTHVLRASIKPFYLVLSPIFPHLPSFWPFPPVHTCMSLLRAPP
jgi:hypothetical protein